MTTLKKLSNKLNEIETRILELMNNGDPNPDQLAELESQAQGLKKTLKVYFSLRAAFDALPENGAGEAYGELLDQMADVISAIHPKVFPLEVIQRKQGSSRQRHLGAILTNKKSPTERV